MTKRKIALLGGTFDPIHLGHTAVAAYAAEHIGAEKVVFIPAKRSPLKNFSPKASGADRLRMIALAITGNKHFKVSDCELKKSGPGYTLETVREFQAEYGSGALIYWLIGADCIEELSRWYGIAELIEKCNLSVMFRAGCQAPDFTGFESFCEPEQIQKLQDNVIETPLINISSTEIRSRLAAGLDVTDMLCPAVADYIRKNNLYQ